MVYYIKESRIEGNLYSFMESPQREDVIYHLNKHISILAYHKSKVHLPELARYLRNSHNLELSRFTQINLSGGANGHLMQNAIDSICLRFSQNDPHYVCILDIRTLVENGVLKFEVEDNGVGIDAKVESLLFSEKQYSTKNDIPNSISRAVAGGGNYGLKETARIISSYHGQVRFKNKGINKGAIFWYEVPIEEITKPIALSLLRTTY